MINNHFMLVKSDLEFILEALAASQESTLDD